MHPRNRYRDGHDFGALAGYEPDLRAHLIRTPDGRTSLNFSDPAAVRLLNRTLLRKDYGLRHWDLPAGHLLPPIPGRLDYVHVLADLIGGATGAEVHGLDIGTGAGLVYPILGFREYGWRMSGTDIDEESLRVAAAILKFNPSLRRGIGQPRQQPLTTQLFRDVIRPGERFDFTLCNPPFYASAEEAAAATRRKWAQLTGRADATRNFGGRPNELWTPGGEAAFLRRMIAESVDFREQVGWFTTLVSQRGYLKAAGAQLEQVGARGVRMLPLSQGKKVRRVLAWRY